MPHHALHRRARRRRRRREGRLRRGVRQGRAGRHGGERAMTRRIRYAMVGGGADALFGGVHRAPIALDGQYELASAALSSTPEKSIASGRLLSLPDQRNHGSWQALLAGETPPPPHAA